MANKMKENKIVDTLSFQIPDDIKTKVSDLKDYEGSNKYLELEIDATHGGYINHNKYYYKIDGQACGAVSFIKPFQKPVLEQHESDSTPIGRIVAAAFIPLSPVKDNTNAPQSKIRLKAVITAQHAIDHILTKRYFTVSTGGSAKEAPKCSICAQDVISIGPLGQMPGCDHQRGQTYEVGDEDHKEKKMCYWEIGEMEYKEVSFINMPADYSPDHVASIVSMKWVDNLEPQDNITLDTPANIVDSEVVSKETQMKKEKTENKKEEKVENKEGKTEDKSKENKVLVIDEDRTLLDALMATLEITDCEDCDENVEDKWESEDDVKAAEAFDVEFTELMNDGVAEDRKLPAAGSEARKKMKTTFCGPNKTFPIPDCKHAAVALAMVNFPRVKAKYSSSVRSRIASCARSRAKTLGCNMAKKKDAEDQVVKIKELEKQISEQKTSLQERDAQVQQATKRINDMSQTIKSRLAEKVVDLAIMSKRTNVLDILQAESDKDRDKLYKVHVQEYIERSEESLKDTIVDLTQDARSGFNVDDKISDPHLNDDVDNSKTTKKVKKEDVEKTRQKKVSSLVFGVDE